MSCSCKVAWRRRPGEAAKVEVDLSALRGRLGVTPARDRCGNGQFVCLCTCSSTSASIHLGHSVPDTLNLQYVSRLERVYPKQTPQIPGPLSRRVTVRLEYAKFEVLIHIEPSSTVGPSVGSVRQRTIAGY